MSALYILNYVEWTDVNRFQKIGQIHAERKIYLGKGGLVVSTSSDVVYFPPPPKKAYSFDKKSLLE